MSAYSFVQYPITVTTVGPFTVSFPYIAKYQVEVRKNGTLLVDGVGYTWPTTSTIQLTANAVNGDLIEVRRNTLKKVDGSIGRLVDWANSAKITESNLDKADLQCFYLAQEAFDSAANAMQLVTDGTYDATNKRIKNVANPINAQDAATKAYGDANWGGSSVISSAANAAAAAASATAAAASATAAATSATNSANSATASATSATNSANSATAAAASAAAAAAVGLPVGGVVYVAGNAAPSNTVKANGALLSRTTFAALWAYAQASGNLVSEASWSGGNFGAFSTGDLSTNFRVPDLRGFHIRAWDDARGLDSGRAIGSRQFDQNKSHSHTITDPGHSHTLDTTQILNGGGGGFNMNGGPAVIGTNASGTGISINVDGGAEVRVHNVALLACIKF